jgi:hypothetical protein
MRYALGLTPRPSAPSLTFNLLTALARLAKIEIQPVGWDGQMKFFSERVRWHWDRVEGVGSSCASAGEAH